MTVVPWPVGSVRGRPKAIRKMIVDPLPQAFLHQVVRDIPGPAGETDAGRAARFQRQLAEVLSLNPRDAAEAMLAAQCVTYFVLALDAIHATINTPRGAGPSARRTRDVVRTNKLLLGAIQALRQRQDRPLPRQDPATFAALGLAQFLIPDPDDPDAIEEAASAVIVPLHPAPKMLQ